MKKKELQCVENALLESTSSYFDGHNVNAIPVGGERSAVLKIKAIESLVHEIAVNDEIHFYEQVRPGLPKVVSTKVGKRLVIYLWAKEEIEKCYPVHDFSPYVKVFFQCVQEHAEAFYHRRQPRYFDADPEVVIESLNRVVERIRCVLRGSVFKSELNAHRRLSNKNYKSLLNYIDAIFDGRSRVLVLRVDLGYAKPIGLRSVREELRFEDVKADREKFLRLVRRKVPTKAFLGYAWKLEYGLSKSYHYHCMFFLDGAKLREDIGWARTIGEIWVDKVTGGQGVYYNCNRRKQLYRSCGIGMIEHSDKGMRANLQKAAMYLTKIEYYIRIVTDGQARTFGRGEMPKRQVKKRGRPRRLPASEDRGSIT
ncbi:hypothetical protein B7453_27625 [Pseudomonas sp. IB20]|uniref:YagK/YfjJ domain-containing protein n=1 Tax=Pseudomonas TaxID=286 RepID=UPI000BA153B2|nr:MULTISPECIES: inovirus-type Gp2 protein [unclassified Pseudomonas]MCV2226031.1 inovirus Gp2 family protein [Pseudomonas sp. AU10]OZO01298.1 hypothetical protein B7453_27625 [Pseudomonas sp. IB20]